MARISIVVPAYNAEKFLDSAIESVQSQTISDWELIIVDDGSKDSTFALACRYQNIDSRIRAFSQENGGVSVARNTGMERSDQTAPFIAFLDADDRYKSDALENLLGALEADPLAVGAHGLASLIDQDGNSVYNGLLESICRPRPKIEGNRVVPSAVTEPTSFSSLIISGCIATPGVVVIRRSTIHKIGPFDQTLSFAEDWDYWIRLARHGHFAYVDQVVLEYRTHGNNSSSNTGGMGKGKIRVLRKAYQSADNNVRHLEIIKYAYRAKHLYEARQRVGYATDSLKRKDISGTIHHTLSMAKNALHWARGKP